MWEMQQISLAREPQTNEAASDLSDRISDIYTALEDQIRFAEGREPKQNLRDGEIIQIG